MDRSPVFLCVIYHLITIKVTVYPTVTVGFHGSVLKLVICFNPYNDLIIKKIHVLLLHRIYRHSILNMRLSETQKDQIINELKISAIRSSGPGGQNVNKVNTKIELRFDLNESTLFTETQKQKLATKLKNRINLDGVIVLFESSERSQLKNKQQAIAKLIEVIEKALTPVKRRVKTKPTISSKLKRLEKKKQNSTKKQLRQRPDL